MNTEAHAQAFFDLESDICDVKRMAELVVDRAADDALIHPNATEAEKREAELTSFSIFQLDNMLGALRTKYYVAFEAGKETARPTARSHDPIYAAIARHRVAWAGYGGEEDADLDRTGDVARAAVKELIRTKPTTTEGAIALAMYYREFFLVERKRHEAQGLGFENVESCGAGLGLIPDVWPFALLDTLAEHFKSAGDLSTALGLGLVRAVDRLDDEGRFVNGIFSAVQGLEALDEKARTGIVELVGAHLARLKAIRDEVDQLRGQ